MTNNRGFSLMELIITIGLMAVILGFAAGPFLDWYRKGKLEDRASSLHETFKWAQTQAMKLGEYDIVNGKIAKQRIYLAVNETANSYKVVQWKDTNSDNVKDTNEFTVLQESSFGNAYFGGASNVNKKACGNTNEAPPGNVANFTSLTCPSGIALFTDYRCARFDGKGFLSSSMQNAVLYITNGTDIYGISLNPAGITTLCRWNGSEWMFVR